MKYFRLVLSCLTINVNRYTIHGCVFRLLKNVKEIDMKKITLGLVALSITGLNNTFNFWTEH